MSSASRYSTSSRSDYTPRLGMALSKTSGFSHQDRNRALPRSSSENRATMVTHAVGGLSTTMDAIRVSSIEAPFKKESQKPPSARNASKIRHKQHRESRDHGSRYSPYARPFSAPPATHGTPRIQNYHISKVQASGNISSNDFNGRNRVPQANKIPGSKEHVIMSVKDVVVGTTYRLEARKKPWMVYERWAPLWDVSEEISHGPHGHAFFVLKVIPPIAGKSDEHMCICTVATSFRDLSLHQWEDEHKNRSNRKDVHYSIPILPKDPNPKDIRLVNRIEDELKRLGYPILYLAGGAFAKQTYISLQRVTDIPLSKLRMFDEKSSIKHGTQLAFDGYKHLLSVLKIQGDPELLYGPRLKTIGNVEYDGETKISKAEECHTEMKLLHCAIPNLSCFGDIEWAGDGHKYYERGGDTASKEQETSADLGVVVKKGMIFGDLEFADYTL